MKLIALLHAMPPWGVYTVVVPSLVLAVLLASFLGRHVCRFAENDARSRGAMEAFKSIVASLAFLMAFLLVQAQGNLQNLEKLVAQEASLLNTLDRSLLRYGTEELAALRPVVRELATTIVTDEWYRIGQGERSPAVEALLNQMSRQIRTTNATTMRQQSLFSEMIGQLDSFSDRREELIAGASTNLPLLFWGTVLALVAVLMVLAMVITPSLERVLTMTGVIAAAGLVTSLVLITEAPFSGEPHIDSAPLTRVVRAMVTRVP